MVLVPAFLDPYGIRAKTRQPTFASSAQPMVADFPVIRWRRWLDRSFSKMPAHGPSIRNPRIPAAHSWQRDFRADASRQYRRNSRKSLSENLTLETLLNMPIKRNSMIFMAF